MEFSVNLHGRLVGTIDPPIGNAHALKLRVYIAVLAMESDDTE